MIKRGDTNCLRLPFFVSLQEVTDHRTRGDLLPHKRTSIIAQKVICQSLRDDLPQTGSE